MEHLDGTLLQTAIRENCAALAAAVGVDAKDLRKRLQKQILSAMSEGRRESEEGSPRRVESQRPWRAALEVAKALVGGLLATSRRPDLGSAVDTLVAVHGHQMLVDGCCNSDPHPGNVLLLRDGRLGLIDYGQVRTFGDDQGRKRVQNG